MIRKAEIKDAGEICEISRLDLGYDECREEIVKSRLETLDDTREVVFAAEEDGIVIGYIHAEKYLSLYFEPMVNVMALAVKREYRNRGIGRALVSEVEKWAKENGIRYIRLNSSASRTAAHIFYRKLGFDSEKDQIRFIKKL